MEADVSWLHHVASVLYVCVCVCDCYQLELLLKYYSEDVRRAVKLSVLTDMAYLAKCTPHMWTSQLIVVTRCS